MRAYAADAYFGVGVTRVGMDYSAINSGVKSKDKYSGLGYRLELGFDWFLAKKFFLTPSISYTISNVKSDTSLGGVKINNFNVAFGFGFSF
jgi:outer membrane protein W